MTEPNPLPALTRRQEDILTHIIHAYTENAEPVSSKLLVDEQRLGISSATVRNEMARLEELGYIGAPHTSAGRVPTALGYRYFVRGLMDNATLSISDQSMITRKLDATPNALDQWMKQAAILLARTSSSASLVTTPITDQTRFKHLEIIGIQGRLTLLVLVLQGGVVHQRMLNLGEPVAQTTLSDMANRINAQCIDLNAPQIRMKLRSLTDLEREVAEIAAEILERSIQHTNTIYQDGLSDIIKAFPAGEGAQQAARVYEEPAFLDLLVRELLVPAANGDIQVIIAGDGRYEEINQLSIVLSRYGDRSGLSGTLGVFGPTNINYDRAIGAVRYVAGKMTDKLAERNPTPANEENSE